MMKLVISIAAIIVAVPLACAAGQDRAFSVKDSIEMTTFSVPSGREAAGMPLISPDQHYFVVVTSRGIISTNEVESTIWLFDETAVRGFLNGANSKSSVSPRVLARVAAVSLAGGANSYEAMVSDLRWTKNSQSIYFLARSSNGAHRLCKIDINPDHYQALTSPDQNVAQYSIRDDVLVYWVTRMQPSCNAAQQEFQDRTASPLTVMTGNQRQSVLFPEPANGSVPQIHELWVVRNGRAHQVVRDSPQEQLLDVTRSFDVLSISPDKNSVVQLNPVLNIPPSWDAYLPLQGFEKWKRRHDDPLATSPSNYDRVRQYVSVNLDTGKVVPLIDAPYGESLAYFEGARAIWTLDGTRLLLTNTLLPADSSQRDQRETRLRGCTVAAVDLPSRQAECIVSSRQANLETRANSVSLRLLDAWFGATKDDVVMEFVGRPIGDRVEYYHHASGRWILIKTVLGARKQLPVERGPGEVLDSVAVSIKQDLNSPPVLWAKDKTTGAEKEIWNPNPQFSNMKFGVASIFHWKDTTGFKWTGGLVLPVDYVPGHRYPLVIQTHGFNDYEFMTDGQYTTAMAARPLASDGIVVLQVATNYKHHGELQEAHLQTLGYEAAIQKLSSMGLIDKKRVGIIGFSRTCWYVESSLIERPNLFAAASLTDGVDHSYMQAMLYDTNLTYSEGQAIYKAKPYGTGLQKWMRLAPGFNLDKIRAPVLVTAIGAESVLEEWEIYSSLYQQRKPVDFLYIRNHEHVLQRPLDRLASQQGNVDWFRFWLQGYKRNDPFDRDEYARWERLLEQRAERGTIE